MPSLSPPPPNAPWAAKRKPKRGGVSAAAVGVPLAAAALFVCLLIYTSSSFSSQAISSHDHRSMLDSQATELVAALRGRQQDRQRGTTATVAAAGDDGGALLLSSSVEDGDVPLSNRDGGGGGGRRRSSWLSAALLWAEEHHQQRLRAKAGRYQSPSGCGQLPCGSKQLQRQRTLVIYAYAAVDSQQRDNFEYFLRYGVEEQDWLRYRLVVASGVGVLAPSSEPQLPPNARYIHTQDCSQGPWGIIAGAASQLEAELAAAQHIVVVGSEVRGPFMPRYTAQFMHWTDAFTTKLGKRTKLVGSALTCEGAPKGGDAADEWRRNPFVLPYAWATDKEGWALMTSNPGVLQCYDSKWDARYHSDSGASLGLLAAGYNIDSLLAKYQGMDWWNQRTWGCNDRVRPDAEWTYDGISISPYETVFVPVSQGLLQSDWSFVRQAVKYTAWLDSQAAGAPQGNANAFTSQQWSLRVQRMMVQNSRGPGCFDFAYYVEANPDLASKSHAEQLLWEHFVMVGQFQGRSHRFTCPLQVGNSYRSSYMHARGRRCFDHNYYSRNNLDVRMAGVAEAHQLFNHYADFGQFEQRMAKFVCDDLLHGLPAGFDSRPLDDVPEHPALQNAAKWQGLADAAATQAAAATEKLVQRGVVSEAAVAAVAAAREAAGEKAAVVAARGKVDVATAAANAAAAMEAERQAAIAGAVAAQAAREQRAEQAQQQAQQAADTAAGGGGGGGDGASGSNAALQQQQAQQQEQQAQQQGQQQAAAEAAAAANAAAAAAAVGAGEVEHLVQDTTLVQAQVQQAVGAVEAANEAAGDAAHSGAFDRIQAADAEAFMQQAVVEAAAGGGQLTA
ncbi:hypothetical protein D9Q98_004276 [Chlorella vulgaris]|uniref:Uncharacterized protein n=1 Tax=Chlorella vulgaris TaxID=3077 RepID=A0A9D4TS22_CHLVU|nr:hypothetical protein D9Q98_004276 [Chlorella vulgaris]